MESEHILQTIALAIFLGVAAQVVSQKLRLPSIILLMLFGIVAGPQALHFLRTHEIPEITSAAISLCIAPGSLDTSLSHAAGLSDIAVCHA